MLRKGPLNLTHMLCNATMCVTRPYSYIVQSHNVCHQAVLICCAKPQCVSPGLHSVSQHTERNKAVSTVRPVSSQKPSIGKLVQKQRDLQLIRSQTSAGPPLVEAAPADLSVYSKWCRKRLGCEALRAFAVCRGSDNRPAAQYAQYATYKDCHHPTTCVCQRLTNLMIYVFQIRKQFCLKVVHEMLLFVRILPFWS